MGVYYYGRCYTEDGMLHIKIYNDSDYNDVTWSTVYKYELDFTFEMELGKYDPSRLYIFLNRIKNILREYHNSSIDENIYKWIIECFIKDDITMAICVEKFTLYCGYNWEFIEFEIPIGKCVGGCSSFNYLDDIECYIRYCFEHIPNDVVHNVLEFYKNNGVIANSGQ